MAEGKTGHDKACPVKLVAFDVGIYELLDFCRRICAIFFALLTKLLNDFWLEVDVEGNEVLFVIAHLRTIFAFTFCHITYSCFA